MRLLRFGICALTVFAVAAHGGVEDWARAVFETGAGLLLVAWALWVYFTRQEQIVYSPLLPPMAALSLLVCGQWFFHATASSYATRTELLLLVSDLVLLFLAVQAFRTLQDWRGFVWFGIALVPLVLGRVRRERWPVVGLFAVVPIGALFLSASRGGIVSFGVELAVLALVMILRRTAGKQLFAGATVLLLALLMVSWLGVGQLLQRFSSFQSLEATAGKRASMRRDTWQIFLHHPVAGTGLGTLQIVYPPYESLYDGKIVNHTHNDYLEALAETGFLGGLCCAWFLGVLFGESLKRFRQPNNSFAGTLQLSGLVACSGFLVHSLVDFNLHIPSNALLFFLMAHLATSEIQTVAPPSPPQRSRHR